MDAGYVTGPQGQIHYRNRGDGPVLVLLHQTGRSSRAMCRLAALLPDLRVVMADLPGFGESAAPRGDPTMDAYGDAVLAVMDELGIDTAHVGGLHFGNKVAAHVAATHPERVNRLILIGMTHSLVLDQEERNLAMRRAISAGSTVPLEGDARRLQLWLERFRTITATWMDPRITRRLALTSDELEELSSEIVDQIQAVRGHDAAYRANFDFDLTGALSSVRAPTLLVEMRADSEGDLDPAGPRLQQIMRDCRVVTLQGNDRTIFRDELDAVAIAVRAFLSD